MHIGLIDIDIWLKYLVIIKVYSTGHACIEGHASLLLKLHNIHYWKKEIDILQTEM